MEKGDTHRKKTHFDKNYQIQIGLPSLFVEKEKWWNERKTSFAFACFPRPEERNTR